MKASLRRGKVSRLERGPGSCSAREGSRLVVLPRPNHRQSEKAMSWDPLPSRDPLPLSLSQRGAGGWGGGGASRPEGHLGSKGGRGPGPKGGRGPGSWCSSACNRESANRAL